MAPVQSFGDIINNERSLVLNVQISSSIFKRVVLAIIAFVIGVAIYWLFDNDFLSKSNLICTITRNYLSDGLWVISFFFIAINFSKNITKRYILLTSIFVLCIGVIFEIMQLTNIANGTFDFLDILVYFIAILIACLVEKKYMEVENEKI